MKELKIIKSAFQTLILSAERISSTERLRNKGIIKDSHFKARKSTVGAGRLMKKVKITVPLSRLRNNE